MNSSKQSNFKKINVMSDAQNPYELEADAMEESIQVMDDGTKFDGEINQYNFPRSCSHYKRHEGGVAELQRKQ